MNIIGTIILAYIGFKLILWIIGFAWDILKIPFIIAGYLILTFVIVWLISAIA